MQTTHQEPAEYMLRSQIRPYLASQHRSMRAVSERQVILADRRGEIPHIQLGRVRYYTPEGIDAWLESLNAAALAEAANREVVTTT
ncbi:hypothetical protein [Mycolicibacterium holsaticum]|uniref:hypothetical protein n=1 Tax=Mycolicibacterium holsaticum TaxID=152142 RepID=UPI001C7D7219|nr:hypothetical protein [Mycolicibacterium holsaticum]MDA4105703.1 hypothetical protein [Mycolicibacterium holsaticum DSM 44478 = JCM 12374]QZA13926.1 hypothetical protein K3U96_07315 [Mycolicibacterium holsaticum DSM 44478 = JCM 12374]UNC08614.1 hypothetical protein H5U41_19515 [Mycolicibacterium holsaticum DSM 44478 = JCM 12374]